MWSVMESLSTWLASECGGKRGEGTKRVANELPVKQKHLVEDIIQSGVSIKKP